MLYAGLKDAGFDVLTAFNGEDGLKLVETEKPDLVLLDLLLPGKSGFGVLSALKVSSTTKDIPVIVITNLDSRDDINLALNSGAVDYLVKSHNSLPEMVKKVTDFLIKGVSST